MCTRPIEILNPKYRSYNFVGGYDSRTVTVPCGTCPDCSQLRQNEWVYRLSAEYDFTKRHNGYTYIDCLTYNDEHIPTLNGFRCFSRNDIKLFFKRLRRNLTRDGFTTTDSNKKSLIKYFVTSEYGHLRHRPHYHILLFCLIPELTPMKLRDYVSRSWCVPYTRSKIGFTDNMRPISDNIVDDNGKFSVKAMEYVSKYCTKDSNVLSALNGQNSTLSTIIRNWCHTTSGKPLSSALTLSDIRSYERCVLKNSESIRKPSIINFNFVSNGLGLSALDNITIDDFMRGSLPLINSSCANTGKIYSIPIPMYYKRRVLYDYDKVSNNYILNNLGLSARDSVCLGSLKTKVNSINPENNINILRSLFSSGFCFDGIDNYDALINRITSVLNGRSLQHYILWKMFFSGRTILCSVTDSKDDLDFFTANIDNIDLLKKYLSARNNYVYWSSRGVEPPSDSINYIQSSSLVAFKNYSYLDSLFTSIQSHINKIVDKHKCDNLQTRELIASQRSKYINFNKTFMYG